MISCQVAASASSIKSSKTSLNHSPNKKYHRKTVGHHSHIHDEECTRLTAMTEFNAGISANADPVYDSDLHELPVPPDGGYGWVIVVISFLCNAIVDGIVYSFGQFQKPLSDHFHQPESKIAFIGSLLSGMYMLDGPLVSAVSNTFGTRVSIIIGSIVGAIGLALSTRATNAGAMMLSYGVISGVGFGFIYLPAVVYVSYYFEKRRSLATGFAACGSGFGIVAMTPFANFLLEVYGWHTANLTLAGIVLSCIILSLFMVPLKCTKIQKVESAINVDPGVHSVLSLNEKIPNTTVVVPTIGEVEAAKSSKPTKEVTKKNSGEELGILNGVLGRNQSQSAFITHIHEIPNTDCMSFLDRVRKSSAIERYRPTLEQIRPVSRANLMSNGDSDTRKLVHVKKSADVTIFASKQNNIGKMLSKTDLDSKSVQFVTSRDNIVLRKDKSEVVRPMSRKDIFYTGSVINLAQFQSQKSLQSYRQRVSSIPICQEKTVLDNVFIEREPRSCCSCKFSGSSFKNVLISILDISLLKNYVFVMIALSSFFSMGGVFVPFAYIERAAKMKGVSAITSDLITSMIGITNTLGRIVHGHICNSPRINTLYVNNLCLAICSVSAFAFSFCDRTWHFMIVASMYGFGCAGFMVLTSLYLVDLLGLEKLTSTFGLLMMFRGAGAISAPPIAAAAFEATKNLNVPFYLTSLLFLLGSVFNLFITVTKYCISSDVPQPVNDYLAPIDEDDEEKYKAEEETTGSIERIHECRKKDNEIDRSRQKDGKSLFESHKSDTIDPVASEKLMETELLQNQVQKSRKEIDELLKSEKKRSVPTKRTSSDSGRDSQEKDLSKGEVRN